MNPVDHPDSFETIELAGEVWPGRVKLGGLKLSMGWDVQDADGKSGATLARKGRKLSTFTCRFLMVRDPAGGIDQFAVWYGTWVPLLKSCFVGADPVGLVCRHADFQALEVDSVVVAEIGQVDGYDDDPGNGYADVALIQYAPAKSVSTGGPNGSKGKNSTNGAGGSGNDPNDPIQKKIDELNALLEGP